MRSRTTIVLLFLSLTVPCFSAPNPSVSLALSAQDKILVLSPHPDDDILGCAGVIQAAVKQQLPVRVVYLTNGDNYEWAFFRYKKRPVLSPKEMIKMGELRLHEAIAAQEQLGVKKEQLTFLGYPDWGTEKIFSAHWGTDGPPFRSMRTQVTGVPYAESYRPGAPYRGQSILSDLEKIIAEFKPTKIFVSHPADGHRDHRAFYLFMQVALWNLSRDLRPEVYPYLVHYPRWPRPRGLHLDETAIPPASLGGISWTQHALSGDEVTRKQEALKRHRTQMNIDRSYLESFVRTRELFGGFAPLPLPGPEPVQVAVSSEVPPVIPALDETNDAAEILWKHVYREGEDIVLRMDLKGGVHLPHPVTVYAFGYRYDRPFAEMPKLRIVLKKNKTEVFDQLKLLTDSGIRLTRDGRTVVLRVPLSSLGVPDRMIATAWSRVGEEPFDWRVWRVLEVKESRNDSRS